MDNLTLDIFKIAVPIIAGIVGWLWKKILSLSDRLIVMETNMSTCKTNMGEDMDSLKEKVNSERDQIHKLIEKIQQRQDSHSKKQDDIVNLFTEFKVEMIKMIGDMTSELSVIGNEVKNINRSFEVFDDGIKRRDDYDDDDDKPRKKKKKKT